MKTVQLAIHDSDYARSVRKLLLRDGAHTVHLVDQPNLRLDGVVVLDESSFTNLAGTNLDPERFLVVTGKDSNRLSRMWEAGIRHVVFEGDSPYTAQLAIIAAELRMPREPGPSTPKQREKNLSPLDAWRFSLRCAKCGPKNAHPGF